MPVIITPVTSPADAKPVQKNSESTPTDAIPVQSGAAATPADSIPSQRAALGSPAAATPSKKSPESTPADAIPVGTSPEPTPTDTVPSQNNALPSPADPIPSQRLPEASPADAIPVQSGAVSTPADTIPVQRSAQVTPEDSTPDKIGTTTTPAVSGLAGADGALGFHSSRPTAKTSDPNVAPVQSATEETPEDEIPAQRSPEPTPVNAIPNQAAAESTPADTAPTQRATADTPADDLPVQKSSQATPSDAAPSQSATASTPADTAPVQLSTATTPAVSGLAGADGALGYHSARPVPKPESSVIPFTHPRICYQSYLDAGTVTVSSGDITAAKSKLTYDKWQPSGSTEWVQVDAGSSVDVDYLAIAAHNLTGRTISLQWSDSGSTGWTTAATTSIDSTDSVVLLLTSPINKRYWRLLVSGASGMSVGVIMIGKALAVQRSINAGHSPITLSRTTVVRPAVSERGQWLGRNVIRSGLSTNIALNNLYADWYRANFDDFVESARTDPFFFAWRPETYPDEVAYCWTTDDITPQNVGHDRINVIFGVDAHA